MRAARTVFLILGLASCPLPEEEQGISGAGLYCNEATEDLQAMSCSQVCVTINRRCVPECRGEDIEAMSFATNEECVDVSEPADTPAHTCEDPIEIDPDLPWVGCCCR
jgi:hypothetical protein